MAALLLVLHTWGQTLQLHPHVHGVATGGGLSCGLGGRIDAAPRWVPCRPGFFLPVRVLSRVFRAQDLAEAVHLSQSALSRLVDRLARHGLVERCGCDVDRRGVYVVLTEAGERRHAEAVPTHRDVLARHLPASMLSAASSGR